MRRISALILSLSLSISSCLYIFTSPAQAAENFSNEYDTTYTVDDTGLTTVEQNVTITNLTSKFFVSKYSFTIGSEEIQNVTAWDPTGAITPEVEKKEGGTVITLNFQARVYGTGKQLRFGISYEFPSLASHNGLLWEINLLKISGLSETARYDLALVVPEGFGPLLYASPPPASSSTSAGKTTVRYSKTELLQSPPRLSFGKFQLYHLDLNYHLENPSVTLGYTEIALPPDIPNQQQIVVRSLTPEPVSIRIDEDGNYLARYNLGPRETKEIAWEGLVALFYTPPKLNEDKIGAIPQELVDIYTQSAKYWEVDDAAIQTKAQELLDPTLSAAKNAKKIFDFVSEYLTYDYTMIAEGDLTRLGALATLDQQEGTVCMGYTDLFIALARAAGIPAREINGFAYASDESHRPLSLRLEGGDVLHAWPQIYLPGNGWTMVDPTWSATSESDYFFAFDLSHITFVTKGLSSEYPLPAGSYKTDPNQRDVKVSLSSEATAVKQLPQLSVEISFPHLSISPFPTTATVRVKNTSGVVAINAQLALTSNLLTIEGTEVISLGVIPPGGETETKIRLMPNNFATRGKETLNATVSATSFAGEEITSTVAGQTTINPLYLPLPLPYLGVLAASIILSAYINRILLRRLQKDKKI